MTSGRASERRKQLRVALGRRLQLFRVARGLTQDHVGAEAGVSQGQVCKWEKGLGEPTFLQMQDMARLLGRELSDFTDLLGSMPRIQVVHHHPPPPGGEDQQAAQQSGGSLA
ncbi:MAG: helix-turn-helix transcriptional regulator [Flavobacteriales bacterium]|nr:helix-turn-helix transcriptional regulator [Flavobacteriales bacterium]